MHPSPAITPPPLRRTRTGFTLIEVLATLVLVAIVLPVVMQGMSMSLGAAAVARSTIEAAQLADAKLNELIATNQAITGASAGDFGIDYPDYRWRVQSVQREDNLLEMAIDITWPWRNGERSITITTLVFMASTTTTTQQ